MTRPFPSCWVLRDIHSREETAAPATLPSHKSRNTSFAIFPEIVPSTIRPISQIKASGLTGESAMAVVTEFDVPPPEGVYPEHDGSDWSFGTPGKIGDVHAQVQHRTAAS